MNHVQKQICRVEDLTVSGVVKGSIIHIHRSKTVTIVKGGVMTASELGEFECLSNERQDHVL